MQNTRQQILAYLEEKPAAAPNEISRALHMTAANARHHLGLLVEEGFIEVIGKRGAKGRGRPARLYVLAHQAMETNIDRLVEALLQLLLRDSASGQPFQALIPILFGKIPPASNTLQRLNQAVQKFNTMKFRINR